MDFVLSRRVVHDLAGTGWPCRFRFLRLWQDDDLMRNRVVSVVRRQAAHRVLFAGVLVDQVHETQRGADKRVCGRVHDDAVPVFVVPDDDEVERIVHIAYHIAHLLRHSGTLGC